MGFNPDQIEMLFASAQQNYVFRYAFESRNPGCEFDVESWTKALNDAVATENLTILNRETAEKVGEILNNLDRFAVKKDQTSSGLQLV